MNAYKYIEILNWKNLQIPIYKWIVENTDILNRYGTGTGFISIDNKILNDLPEIRQAFSSINFRIIQFSIFYKNNYHVDKPHLDVAPWDARINFPILNCDQSFTVFYSAPEDAKTILKKNFSGAPYVDYEPGTKFKEITRCIINQPTVISIKTLHGVVVPVNSPIPRITATVAVDPDPIFLLRE